MKWRLVQGVTTTFTLWQLGEASADIENGWMDGWKIPVRAKLMSHQVWFPLVPPITLRPADYSHLAIHYRDESVGMCAFPLKNEPLNELIAS